MIGISPRGVLVTLLAITGLLLLGHAIVTVAEFGFGHDHVLGLRRLLDFNGEGNAPAWFSSLLFCFCAVLLGVIWHAHRAARNRFRSHWAVLAAVFLFLALDEAAAVHEKLIDPVRSALDTGGVLLHAWIIPYGIALVFLLVVYLPFLRALPARTLRLMLAAGAVYVAGAIGVEIVGGYVWDRNPARGVAIVAIMAFEETLEMVGLALFAYTLLDYLARVSPLLEVRIGEQAT
ncbi:MAG TPA: hypothetical protein VFT04_10145 [Gemmatimonadales bacterium]|nr:hypothetical protein [Gemmatimonadales bacterium]